MKKLVGFLSALVPAGVAGCTSTPASGSMPCESCSYGYVPVKKSLERRVFCMVDDKQVDCTKNQKGCPECAKQMQKK